MKLVIPLAGKDTRYEEAFGTTKPLVDVNGKPLLHWCLENLMENFSTVRSGGSFTHRSSASEGGRSVPATTIFSEIIFICLKEEVEKYDMEHKLKAICPNSKVVIIKELTEGAVCSVLKAEQFINTDEGILIYLADILINSDLTKAISERDKDTRGIIPVFESQNPKYSYVNADENLTINKVAEKKVISNLATSGIYFFASGKEFVAAAKNFIKNDENRVRGLFFIAPVFNELIKENKKVRLVKSEFLFGLGSPEEVENFKNQQNHLNIRRSGALPSFAHRASVGKQTARPAVGCVTTNKHDSRLKIPTNPSQ